MRPTVNISNGFFFVLFFFFFCRTDVLSGTMDVTESVNRIQSEKVTLLGNVSVIVDAQVNFKSAEYLFCKQHFMLKIVNN